MFVLQVDSVNKHGILLDVVQVISDMNLVIKKAYISSDGVWFMDGNFLSKLLETKQIHINFASDPSVLIWYLFFYSVFNVTDRNGSKIKDKEVIDYIQRVGSCVFAIS